MTFVILVVVLACWKGFEVYVMWKVFGGHDIEDSTYLPEMLATSLEVLGDDQVQEIHAFDRGGLVYKEYFWSARFLNVQAAEQIFSQSELEPVRPSEVTLLAFSSEPKPSWWNPQQTETTQYYASAGFEAHQRGPEGEIYFCSLDTETGQVFAWLKSNYP